MSNKEEEVFETPDYDEIDKREPLKQNVIYDENIISSNIIPQKSFEVFMGKSYITIPEKDSISNYTNTLSIVGQNTNENNNKILESPLEKYLRLKTEVDELKDMMDTFIDGNETKDDNNNNNNNNINQFFNNLNNEVNILSQNLNLMNNDPKYKILLSDEVQNDEFFNNNDNNVEELLNYIKNIQLNNKNNNNDNNNNDNNENLITYELYSSSSNIHQNLNPKTTNYFHSVSMLDDRLRKMENLLGPIPDSSIYNKPELNNNNILTKRRSLEQLKNSHKYSLLERLDYLENQYTIIDYERLEKLFNKGENILNDYENINQKLNENNNNQSNLRLLEHTHRISSLYEKFQKIEPIIDDLPNILSRLKTLQRVHQSTIDMTNRIESLENCKDTLEQSFNDDKELLNELETNFKDNMVTILNNIKIMDEKIMKLKK